MVDQYAIAAVGDIVTFVCHSTIQVKWLFNDEELPGNVKVNKLHTSSNSYTLTINKVGLDNTGQYECFGKTTQNLEFKDKGQLDVIG